MSLADRFSAPRRRKLVVPAVLLAALLVAVVALRRPLVAWFTGRSATGEQGRTIAAQAGPFSLRAALDPDPPRERGNALVLDVTAGPGGAPVDDATIDVRYDMPAMGAMPEMKGSAKVSREAKGRYRAEFDVPTGGSWTLQTRLASSLGRATQDFTFTVGTAGLSAGSSSGGGPAAVATAAPFEYPPAAFDTLRSATEAYDRVRASLAAGALAPVATHARTLAEALSASMTALPSARADLVDDAKRAAGGADRLAAAGSLDDARRAFAEVSAAFVPLVAADARLSADVHAFECPMFEGHPRWMQREASAENPYMGPKMPACGTPVALTAAAAPASDRGAATAGSSEIDHYTCPMHTSVDQKTPGKCPICGMDLVPVTKEQQAAGVVMIDAQRRQLIGVRTAPVVVGPMRASFRAVGRVTYDETALADVTLKVRGWISKLYVDRTGQRVARGQTLFLLYSPEIYNAEQDFLLAGRSAGGGQGFAHAARQRLRLLGVGDAQIDAIAAAGAPQENVAFASPAAGFVIEKNVVEGASVDAGARLYRLAALDKVWVDADVYEADLAHVRPGQPATVQLDYQPDHTFDAKVTYVYPYLEQAARTGKVRIELANKGLELRPGMYATVSLSRDLGTRVQVPASAVVYTGPRRVVFVDLGGGRLRPTEVRIGDEAAGMYEVLSGLSPGDVVATSGVFLIAAEARIRTAATYWSEPGAAADAGAAGDPTRAAP